MKYFKNTELAKLYHVSEKSVRNWIESAQAGKLDLQLFDKNEKKYIANTSKNTLLIEKQVEKGKKFKNTRGSKNIHPGEKFYKTFSQKQIFDLISNLTIHHEVPLCYTYVDGGADFWDKYALRLVQEEMPNLLNSTVDLLEGNFEQLKKLLGNRKVNVIDLGPGNGLPIRDLLAHLLQHDQLNRYIAIDMSKSMLDIAKKHITSWFGEKVKFEGYVRDFSYERFDDIIGSEQTPEMPLNLVLLLGGTLSNFRSPNLSLQAINNSLGIDDLFIYSSKLDTPNSRRYFDFNITAGGQGLAPRHRLPFDLMEIDESYYRVEQFFDETKFARFITIKPNVDLCINFQIGDAVRKVELLKDEPILVWRFWHYNATDIINQFERYEFDLMQVSRSKDQEFLLVMATIKHQ